MKIGDMIKPIRHVELYRGKLYPSRPSGDEFLIYKSETGETTPAAMIIGQERVTHAHRKRTMIMMVKLLIAGEKVLVSTSKLKTLFEVV
tara:strand:+ start:145 stop:411 length:267 start_codon:yes stop_codon:yes gene_type:complete